MITVDALALDLKEIYSCSSSQSSVTELKSSSATNALPLVDLAHDGETEEVILMHTIALP